MKKAIVSVINDLSTDQRVHRHCMCLNEQQFQVQLVGRKLKSSLPLQARDYSTFRFRLPFESGPLFYATYNIRLFIHLLFSKVDLLFSNDLDTLLPNYLVSRLRNIDLIYDSHELFSEVPEVKSRPRVQRVWKFLERTIMPKLRHMLTVNVSIADTYEKWYGVKMKVHRNLPVASGLSAVSSRKELGLPSDNKLIVLQGAGINVDRGAEEAVLAMRYLNNHMLVIIGTGDVIGELKKMAEEDGIKGKVRFTGRLPYSEMMAITANADLGLSLDKDTNLNYRFSLSNKLFDYIQAGTPVLASNLVEVAKVVNENNVGWILKSHEPEKMASQILEILNNEKELTIRTERCAEAAKMLTWENEKKVLENMIAEING